MKKKASRARASVEDWVGLGRDVLHSWKGHFEAPLWSHVNQDVSADMLESVDDGGRSIALAGVRSILGDDLWNDISEAAEILSESIRDELLRDMRPSEQREALAAEVAMDVANGVLGELCLLSLRSVGAWIPGYSRALDAWGAGLALGGGTDEAGSWSVESLGLSPKVTFGPSGFHARHAVAVDAHETAQRWVRAVLVEEVPGGARTLDLMDVVHGILNPPGPSKR